MRSAGSMGNHSVPTQLSAQKWSGCRPPGKLRFSCALLIEYARTVPSPAAATTTPGSNTIRAMSPSFAAIA